MGTYGSSKGSMVAGCTSSSKIELFLINDVVIVLLFSYYDILSFDFIFEFCTSPPNNS